MLTALMLAALAATPGALAPPAVDAAKPGFGVAALDPLDEFGGAAPSADLGRVRAGDGKTVYQAVTEQTLAATNSGNVVSGTTIGSGAVTFGPNALSGFNGVGNFVVNTGHNNNLQGAITVNVLITPGK